MGRKKAHGQAGGASARAETGSREKSLGRKESGVEDSARILPKARATIVDVARVAGVHHGTVSRALGGDARVAAGTRERIIKIAGELGYSPDPHMKAFSRYRRNLRERPYQATVAWVTQHNTREGWVEHASNWYRGLIERATQLGFHVENFWLREPGQTTARLQAILRARGITGVIFAPASRPHAHVRWASDEFSMIRLGQSVISPAAHLVANDHFLGMRSLVRRLIRMGYRRIGAALWPATDSRTEWYSQASFRYLQANDPRVGLVPLLAGSTWSRKDFLAWVRHEKPDVVVTDHPDAGRWLREAGFDIPRKLGVALSFLPEGETTWVEGASTRASLAGKQLASPPAKSPHKIRP